MLPTSFSRTWWTRALALSAVSIIIPLFVGAQQAASGTSEDKPAHVEHVVLTVTPFLAKGTSRKVSAAATAAAATITPSTSPPFNECPPVGRDSSCGVLVIVTDSGGTVLSDPSQPPFDGIEDTLTGVL